MSLSRRFLNLIVDSRIRGVRTLRRIDLTRQQFFQPEPPLPPNGNGHTANEPSEMERIRLPRPIATFRASASDGQLKLHCFPMADAKVLCADQSGGTFLFDTDTRHVVTMPCLHKPKVTPFSLFVPSSSASACSGSDSDTEWDHHGDYVEDGVGSLFVMEGTPEREPSSEQPSEQFEAYIYGQRSHTSLKTWDCHLLPPPPFVSDPSKRCPLVTSYAVVGDGSHIVVSAEGAGTYLMDTVNHAWQEVGSWLLPFYGKVEYVPELKLWFGLSSAKGQLAAADLSTISTMASRPRLLGNWKEFSPHEDWEVVQEPQLVNLGSGRFCVARFFETGNLLSSLVWKLCRVSIETVTRRKAVAAMATTTPMTTVVAATTATTTAMAKAR